ncbi:hypothetical protein [Methylomagnum sp.]
MLSLKIDYEVPEDRRLFIQLPEGVKPGKHQIIVVVDNSEENTEFSSEQASSVAIADHNHQMQESEHGTPIIRLNPAKGLLNPASSDAEWLIPRFRKTTNRD